MVITIAMNTYNNAETVAEAIESVLAQSSGAWKLSIIDANSSDETVNICEHYAHLDSRISLSSKKFRQSWVTSTREQIMETRTDFFMILDADDRISSNWIEELTKDLASSDAIGAYGSTMRIDFNGMDYSTNLSHGQSYAYTQSKIGFIRILFALSLPESLGLVNMCYSVWKTDIFRDIAITSNYFSDEFPWLLDFDRIFILESLSRGRFLSVRNASIFRRTKNAIPHDKLPLIVSVQHLSMHHLKRIFLLVIQPFRVKPSTPLLIGWMKQKPLRFIYSPILIVRIILSIFSVPVDKVLTKASRVIGGKVTGNEI